MNTCTLCKKKLTKLSGSFRKEFSHANKQWIIDLCGTCAPAILNFTIDTMDHDNLSILLGRIGKERKDYDRTNISTSSQRSNAA